ncbi:glycosyltransferase [Christiangramia sp.]|uniref:glycosyltransferase n=1 Tax=Christiangramia sp. TaxID=1931228 RepID=UPI0026146769|nr:glycosyltransferase [Christiangramia sp.]
MKLLITTPFLVSVGGTEIETLITAQELAGSGQFQKIEIFSPYKPELQNFQDLIVAQNIKFITYPDFFKKPLIKKINTFLRRVFNIKYSFIEDMYWKLQFLKRFDYVYVLTSPSQKYYFPIFRNFDLKKCLVKYTMIEEQDFKVMKKEYLKAIKWNIVMSYRHKDLFNTMLDSNNIVVQDIIIANEERLLQSKSNRSFTFGLLSRFSREKRIEQAILLIYNLTLSGFNPNLIIQGEGDNNYVLELEKLIEEYSLGNNITLLKRSISPSNTHLFYKNISFFLITSKFETGPLTGLEAMAAGVPVLSVDVGAMKERLGKHTDLIVNDFEEMVEVAKNLMQLNDEVYHELSTSIKKTYISNCSNSPKIKSLGKLFFN